MSSGSGLMDVVVGTLGLRLVDIFWGLEKMSKDELWKRNVKSGCGVGDN